MITVRELKEEDRVDVEKLYYQYWDDGFEEHLATRTEGFIGNDSDMMAQDFRFYVAENNGELVGIVAYRKVPSHMMEYVITSNAAELYVIAVKQTGMGIGKQLVEKVIQLTKEKGYVELVLFSGETHSRAYKFYLDMGFKEVGDAIAPNGEKGKIIEMMY